MVSFFAVGLLTVCNFSDRLQFSMAVVLMMKMDLYTQAQIDIFKAGRGRTSVKAKTIEPTQKQSYSCSRGLNGAELPIELVSVETYDQAVKSLFLEVAASLDRPSISQKIGICRRLDGCGFGMALPWTKGIKPFVRAIDFIELIKAYPFFKTLQMEKDLALVLIIDPRGDPAIHNGLSRLQKELGAYDFMNKERAGYFFEPNGYIFQCEDGSETTDAKAVIVAQIDEFCGSGS